MIKNFEEFTKRQSFSNGYTQWCKTYSDGQEAWMGIDDTNITRHLVRSGFKAQENGFNGAVFCVSDLACW